MRACARKIALPAISVILVGSAIRVQPFDRVRCVGCSQLLRFDQYGYVPEENLRACQSRCEWVLVERNGVVVAADPVS
jgi:hypothetical protein